MTTIPPFRYRSQKFEFVTLSKDFGPLGCDSIYLFWILYYTFSVKLSNIHKISSLKYPCSLLDWYEHMLSPFWRWRQQGSSKSLLLFNPITQWHISEDHISKTQQLSELLLRPKVQILVWELALKNPLFIVFLIDFRQVLKL